MIVTQMPGQSREWPRAGDRVETRFRLPVVRAGPEDVEQRLTERPTQHRLTDVTEVPAVGEDGGGITLEYVREVGVMDTLGGGQLLQARSQALVGIGPHVPGTEMPDKTFGDALLDLAERVLLPHRRLQSEHDLAASVSYEVTSLAHVPEVQRDPVPVVVRVGPFSVRVVAGLGGRAQGKVVQAAENHHQLRLDLGQSSSKRLDLLHALPRAAREDRDVHRLTRIGQHSRHHAVIGRFDTGGESTEGHASADDEDPGGSALAGGDMLSSLGIDLHQTGDMGLAKPPTQHGVRSGLGTAAVLPRALWRNGHAPLGEAGVPSLLALSFGSPASHGEQRKVPTDDEQQAENDDRQKAHQEPLTIPPGRRHRNGPALTHRSKRAARRSAPGPGFSG